MSRQPFCPRAYAFEKLDKKFSSKEDWSGQLVLDVGTAIHTVMQMWIPLKFETFGNWCCPTCHYATRNPIWHLGPCPKCNGMLSYVELEFRDKDLVEYSWDEDGRLVEEPLTGHCDGIVKFWNYNILIDYKTTSGYKLKQLKEPYFSYKQQTTIYAKQLETHHNIKIDFIVIFYLDRDVSPANFDWKPFVFVPDYSLYFSYVEAMRLAKKSVQKGKIPKFGICTTKDKTYYCPHVDRCFNSSSVPPSESNPDLAQQLTGDKIPVQLTVSLGKWIKPAKNKGDSR